MGYHHLGKETEPHLRCRIHHGIGIVSKDEESTNKYDGMCNVVYNDRQLDIYLNVCNILKLNFVISLLLQYKLMCFFSRFCPGFKNKKRTPKYSNQKYLSVSQYRHLWPIQ